MIRADALASRPGDRARASGESRFSLAAHHVWLRSGLAEVVDRPSFLRKEIAEATGSGDDMLPKN